MSAFYVQQTLLLSQNYQKDSSQNYQPGQEGTELGTVTRKQYDQRCGAHWMSTD